MDNLYNVFKQVCHIGQCNPNDVNFVKLQEWYDRWKDDPDFVEVIEDWYEQWLKDNPKQD